MPWARLTDTAATHPIVLAVAEHPDADDRSVNEVFGFMLRLAAMSAQYLTDYVFWYSSAVQMAGSKSQADHLLELAAFAGYGVQDVEPGSGRRFFRLVADPDFVHIKTAEEVAWERDRKANNGDLSIIVPVRWRDGDACRYCGKVVNWADRKGGKGGTYDHRLPGQSGTWRSEVVACRSCNSIRGNASKGLPPSEGMAAADRVRPLLSPPDRPYYSPRTREWLNSHADVLALHNMRPPELAAEGTKPLRAGSDVRTSSQTVDGVGAGIQSPRPEPVSTSSLPGSQPDQAPHRRLPGRADGQSDRAGRVEPLTASEERPAPAARASRAPDTFPSRPASQAGTRPGRAPQLHWGRPSSSQLGSPSACGDDEAHVETVDPAGGPQDAARAAPGARSATSICPDLPDQVRSGQIETGPPGTESGYAGSGRDGQGRASSPGTGPGRGLSGTGIGLGGAPPGTGRRRPRRRRRARR